MLSFDQEYAHEQDLLEVRGLYWHIIQSAFDLNIFVLYIARVWSTQEISNMHSLLKGDCLHCSWTKLT